MQDKDYSDYWLNNAGALNGLWGAISYQRSIGNYLDLEIDLGVNSSASNDNHVIYPYDKSSIQLTSVFLSPTLKWNINLKDGLYMYLGMGPDLYQSQAKWRYNYPMLGNLKAKESKLNFGVHGLVGFEAIIYGDPKADGWADLPMSLFVEYRYSWVEWRQFNKKPLRTLGLSSSKYDLNIGGHYPALGLRWHF